MRRIAIAALFAALGSAPAFSAATTAAQGCTPRHMCCKVCNRGQACGDTCISRERQCQTPPGCACDRVDVCD
ncbi:MAG: hypothetical protein JJ863_23820 [Deltaproteobacteria bacterium]|nr:hypothetical protein [Deltaproteobacteria bacterium]